MTDEKLNNDAGVPDPYDMAVKRALHHKADEKNFLESRKGRLVLCCGAKKGKKPNPDAKCRSLAGMGTDHPGYGRCKFCAGNATGPKTPEGKAKVAQNGRKHGLYSKVLSDREREIFETLQAESNALSLEYEINMHKAKILIYLEDRKADWDRAYQAKITEDLVKYRCTDTATNCGYVWVAGSLEGKPTHCPKCAARSLYVEEVERWPANRSDIEAKKYADAKSKVYYSESEHGGRSYYHAATIEDRVLDRALNTLSRLIEKQARLKGETKEEALEAINAELMAASQVRVSLSWGSTPQHRGGSG